MAGTNMNTVLSFANEVIQTQQNVVMQGLASTAAASNEAGVGFDEYMKASVSSTEEQKNYRSVEKTVTVAEQNVKTTEITNVSETTECSESSPQEKTEANQVQEIATQEETKDVLGTNGTENQDKPINTEFFQEIQEFSEKVEVNVENQKDLSGNLPKDLPKNLPKDLKEALVEIEGQLKQKIMEGFDITEDELKEALEVLAISIYDLLQTNNLKELAVYVSGEESLVSLVTNGDMYEVYKEAVTCIEEVSTTLMDKLSLSPEELQEIIPQLKNITLDEQQNTVSSVNTEGVSEEAIMQETSEQSVATAEPVEETGQPEILVEVSETMEPTKKENADEKVAFLDEDSIQTKEKVVETTTEDSATQQQKDFTSTSGEGEKKALASSKENSVVQTNTSYSTVVSENQVQTVVKTQQTDFDGIVRQIVEQIKVEIKPDVSSMELQLNPENLGKVNLHVTSKEGVITAQFFVQNETVKTMIEGQLAVLREAMNEQGVKVEAVEVTVETGQFGRSLEQHSEQQKQQAEKQAKSYQHRTINLLTGMDEESMNDEEMLRVHIMRESGNSVDMNV